MTSLDGLNHLIDDLQKGDVVIIAGAGVTNYTISADSIIGSWKQFLISGLDYCIELCNESGSISENSNEFIEYKNSITSAHFLEIGESIIDFLISKNALTYWLNDLFKNVSIIDDSLILAIDNLNCRIATTNYDNLFEQVLNAVPITWETDDRLQLHNFVKNDSNKKLILHIHGYFEKPDTIVLGKKSYAKLVNSIASTIEVNLGFSNSILLIGFGDSVNDPNFTRLLNWLNRHTVKWRIYVLVLATDLEKYEKKYKGKHRRTFIIEYGNNYSDLPIFLNKIALKLPSARHLVDLPSKIHLCGIQRRIFFNNFLETSLSDNTKPLCVLGGPGVGKSNLLINFVLDRKSELRYRNRRYFVDCEFITDVDSIFVELYKQFEEEIQTPPAKIIRQKVYEYLSKKPSLLILDGLEVLWDKYPNPVEEILAKLSNNSINLIIGFRGAKPPGRLPWKTFFVEQLNSDDALIMFNFFTDNKFISDRKLNDMVAEMDGLPLAIHLLIGRILIYYDSLDSIWNDWQIHKTAYLRNNSIVNPLKKDSLNICLDFSFFNPRIKPSSRQLIKALAILPSGIKYDEIREIFPGRHDDIEAILESSLCYLEKNTDRLRILQPIREYLISNDSCNAENDLEVLTVFYTKLSLEFGPKMGFKNSQNYFLKIHEEWNNILTILEYTVHSETSIKAIVSLTRYQLNSGRYPFFVYEKALKVSIENKWESLRADLLQSLGVLYYIKNEYTKAYQCYAEAKQLYEVINDKLGVGKCLIDLGEIYYYGDIMGDKVSRWNLAKEFWETSIQIFEELNRKANNTNVLFQLYLGISKMKISKMYNYFTLKEIMSFIEESNALLNIVNYDQGIANCAESFAFWYFNLATHEGLIKALEYYNTGLKIYTDIGSEQGKANCLVGLAMVYNALNEFDKANAFALKGKTLYTNVGSNWGVSLADSQIASSTLLRAKDCFNNGHLKKAKRMVKEAREIYRLNSDTNGIEQCDTFIDSLKKLD